MPDRIHKLGPPKPPTTITAWKRRNEEQRQQQNKQKEKIRQLVERLKQNAENSRA